jgi:diaminohydroxyphosphoribosylaminopyrimidine deaminase / 5-amino-6-(5-phosphoribosylamino)uracil reductase
MTPEDLRWMRVALLEAQRGLGTTSPNPPVGAAIVSAAGQLLGKGHHQIAGGPHAEINALRAVSPQFADQISGATAYVTLEPCSTHGRTPPCSEALVRQGIRRVVWATHDPNPAHAGRAQSYFTAHGISCEVGVLHAEAAELLRPWTCYMTRKRPYVVAKIGMSLDACLTLPPGEGQWLTCPASRQDANRLRLLSDAILVGGETVRQDNPSLTIRPPELFPAQKKPLLRVAWTSQPLPKGSNLATNSPQATTLALSHATPQEILSDLATRGVVQLLVEGGSRVLTQFLTHDLVDELHVYIAPRISGHGKRFLDLSSWNVDISKQFKVKDTKIIGQDIKIVYLS